MGILWVLGFVLRSEQDLKGHECTSGNVEEVTSFVSAPRIRFPFSTCGALFSFSLWFVVNGLSGVVDSSAEIKILIFTDKKTEKLVPGTAVLLARTNLRGKLRICFRSIIVVQGATLADYVPW